MPRYATRANISGDELMSIALSVWWWWLRESGPKKGPPPFQTTASGENLAPAQQLEAILAKCCVRPIRALLIASPGGNTIIALWMPLPNRRSSKKTREKGIYYRRSAFTPLPTDRLKRPKGWWCAGMHSNVCHREKS